MKVGYGREVPVLRINFAIKMLCFGDQHFNDCSCLVLRVPQCDSVEVAHCKHIT